jgi:hypothetical protein
VADWLPSEVMVSDADRARSVVDLEHELPWD